MKKLGVALSASAILASIFVVVSVATGAISPVAKVLIIGPQCALMMVNVIVIRSWFSHG